MCKKSGDNVTSFKLKLPFSPSLQDDNVKTAYVLAEKCMGIMTTISKYFPGMIVDGNPMLLDVYKNKYDKTKTTEESEKEDLNNIIDEFIPNHIREEYRNELENIFKFGWVNHKINWETGHKEMKTLLKPKFDDRTIPHPDATLWTDFVIKNFTQKGKEISKKSVLNEITRDGWQ